MRPKLAIIILSLAALLSVIFLTVLYFSLKPDITKLSPEFLDKQNQPGVEEAPEELTEEEIKEQKRAKTMDEIKSVLDANKDSNNKDAVVDNVMDILGDSLRKNPEPTVIKQEEVDENVQKSEQLEKNMEELENKLRRD